MHEDFLKKVFEQKKADIQAARKTRTEESLRREAEARQDRRPFIDRLKPGSAGDVHIIAEVKRASPSKGDIRSDLDAALLAAAYERGGAAAVSVLTESRWFKGSIADLQAARAAVSLPVLRKDFIFEPYQIYESAAAGADAVLLIVALLGPAQLDEYLEICESAGVDALVEIHSPRDLEMVVESRARLIGINNRNLRTLETDIQIAINAAAGLAPGQIPVAASGIRTRGDIEKNMACGICNFLIGEHLVRADDPEAFLRELTAPPNPSPLRGER
ncbi:MAG: indole-3-glycerol phosphate synthase TrpC [Desulfobacterales bacterium]|nr:indole-3-glycerol phosphate synthase TrpC [Desulfobacterales bacterium]